MNKKEREIPSIALLSADLAWSLLTPKQQQQSLEYLEKVGEKEQTSESTKEIHSKR